MIKSNKECEGIIKTDDQKLYIADEFVEFITKKEFTEYLRRTGSWLVYVSRTDKVCYLNFSVHEIYTLKSSESNNYYMTSMSKIYFDNKVYNFLPDIIVTEDSKSGHDIIDAIISCKVLSADGKDNVYNVIKRLDKRYNRVMLMVDCAAFGANIAHVRELSVDREIVLFEQESFEWLILGYEMFLRELNGELDRTYDFCDTSKYYTWETYYTALLRKICGEYGIKYNKESWNRLDRKFKENKFLKYVSDRLIGLNDSVKVFGEHTDVKDINIENIRQCKVKRYKED